MDGHVADPRKKFMFDINNFDEEALRKKREAARRPTFGQEEMEAARQTGFDAGRQAGMKEAIASQESQIRDVLQQIVLETERLGSQESERLATFTDQAAQLAAQMMGKALPALLQSMAVEQIALFIRGVVEEQSKKQDLVISVAPSRVEAVKARFDDMAASMRRTGTTTVEADPTMGDLQCHIEWSGGGANWDPQRVGDALMAAIEHYLPDHLKAAAPAATLDETAQTPHTDDSTAGDLA